MSNDEWFVTMPKLGETVTEGELTNWLKQVGDKIEFDDPLFEVSTDKVDSEIPSPYDGVIAEILVQAVHRRLRGLMLQPDDEQIPHKPH